MQWQPISEARDIRYGTVADLKMSSGRVYRAVYGFRGQGCAWWPLPGQARRSQSESSRRSRSLYRHWAMSKPVTGKLRQANIMRYGEGHALTSSASVARNTTQRSKPQRNLTLTNLSVTTSFATCPAFIIPAVNLLAFDRRWCSLFVVFDVEANDRRFARDCIAKVIIWYIQIREDAPYCFDCLG